MGRPCVWVGTLWAVFPGTFFRLLLFPPLLVVAASACDEMPASADQAGAAVVALNGDLADVLWGRAVLQGSWDPRPGGSDVEFAVAGRLPDDGDVPLRMRIERFGVVDLHPLFILFVGRWIPFGLLVAGEKTIAVDVVVVVRQGNGCRSVEGGR